MGHCISNCLLQPLKPQPVMNTSWDMPCSHQSLLSLQKKKKTNLVQKYPSMSQGFQINFEVQKNICS